MRKDPLDNLDQNVEFQQELKELIQSPKALVVHNDDFNTFECVIDALVDLCGHDSFQAEQCAYIIHNKGKCCVKTDMFEKLQPIWARFLELEITATIEDAPKLAR